MVAATGLRKENNVEPQAPSPSRGEVLARYRRLREISKRHLSDAMKYLSQDTILHHARRLGLMLGRTVIVDNMDELAWPTILRFTRLPTDVPGPSIATPDAQVACRGDR